MKKLTKEEFIEHAKCVHGDAYDYSKVNYINSRTKVCIICPIHGEFWLTPTSFLRGHGCKKCSKTYLKNTKEFVDLANIVHNYKYQYLSEYINARTKIKILCPEHGLFEQLPILHLKGACCPKCARENARKKLYLDTKEFINRANLIHNKFYDYSLVNYISNKTPIQIICPEHGIFELLPVNHLQGCGCKKCRLKAQTKLYKQIQEAFPDLEFIFEATNKDIPWAKMYRFDIYNKKYNFIIEYDGELHFLSIKFFGGDKKFKIRQNIDQIKNALCADNKCTLFRIKYNYTELDLNELKQNINLILNLYYYEIKSN